MNAVVALMPGAVMVTAGGLCVCGALAAKRLIGIAGAAVMFAAMVDLAFFDVLPPLIWSVALVAAGLLLGIELRQDSVVSPPATRVDRIARGIDVAIALAYPAMAWLILAHGSGTRATTGAGTHVGHASSLWFGAMVVTLILAALLTVLSVLSARQRHRLLAFEAAGMAAMLLVMLLPHG